MRKATNRGVLTGVFCLAVLLASSATNPDSTTKQSIFDQLSGREVTDVTIVLNLSELTQNKFDTLEHKGELTFTDLNGEEQSWDIKAALRGKFRRSKCSGIPPLKLKFKKKHLKIAGLAKYNDMKLVNYCVEDQEEARDYLLREFLIYKLYNELTDASFRVQLLRIRYVDAESGDSREQMGFLIEDTAQLRARLNAQKSKSDYAIYADDFDQNHRKMAALFQYLIGNADWELTSSKNVKYVLRDEKIIPVPYDFDFAALVKPSYARLNSSLGQTNIEQRFYLGFEENLDELEEVLSFYKKKRKAMVQTIKNFKLLQGKSRRYMVAYLNSFYWQLDEGMQFGPKTTAVGK
ncbi:MAG: hypothetical protein AAF990_18425 [Bacteroidota bacterium]